MKEKRNLLTGTGLIGTFALWTVLIQCLDAGIICLTILVVKGLLIGKGKSLL